MVRCIKIHKVFDFVCHCRSPENKFRRVHLGRLWNGVSGDWFRVFALPKVCSLMNVEVGAMSCQWLSRE